MTKLNRPLGLAFALSVLVGNLSVGSGQPTGHGSAAANKLYKEKKYSQSLDLYKQVLIKRPESAEVLYWLGLNELSLGHDEQALDYLNHSIKIKKTIEALAARGDCFYNLDKYDNAKADFLRCIQLDGKNPRYQISLGRTLIESENFDEALRAFTAAIELKPKSTKGYAERANALRTMKRYFDALDECDRAIAIDPMDGFVYQTRAMIRKNLKDEHGALEDIQRAVKLTNEDSDVYQDQADILLWLKKYVEAKTACDKAIEFAEPREMARLHSDRACCNYHAGDYWSALKDMDEAVRLAPQDPGNYKYRAHILTALKRFDEADLDLQKSIGLDYSKHSNTMSSLSLTPEKMWGLACSAVLFDKNGHDSVSLAGMPLTDASRSKAKKFFERTWKVYKRADFLRAYSELLRTSDHFKFSQLAKVIDTMSPNELSVYEKEIANHADSANKLLVTKRYYKEIGSTGLLGWDLARAVNGTRMAYAAGIIEEDEAWARILNVAIRIQNDYNSWKNFGYSYLVGRKFWSESRSALAGDEFERAYERQIQIPNSPYQKCPWSLPLKPAFQEAVRTCIANGHAKNIADIRAASEIPLSVSTADQLRAYVESTPSPVPRKLRSLLAASENEFVGVLTHMSFGFLSKPMVIPETLLSALTEDGIATFDRIAVIAKAIYRFENDDRCHYEALLREYKQKAAKTNEERFGKILSETEAQVKVRRLMLGWKSFSKVECNAAPKLPVYEFQRVSNFPIIDAGNFGKGVLLIRDETPRKLNGETVSTASRKLGLLLFDPIKKSLNRIALDTADSIASAVLLNGKLYALARTNSGVKLLTVDASTQRSLISNLPENDESSILGYSQNTVVFISKSKISILNGDKWETVFTPSGNLNPQDLKGACLLNRRLYFSDEEEQVAWLDLSDHGKKFRLNDVLKKLNLPSLLFKYDYLRPQWMRLVESKIWVSCGSPLQSLVQINDDGSIRFALYSGRTSIDPMVNYLIASRSPAAYVVSNAICRSGEDLVMIGDNGLYRVRDSKINLIATRDYFKSAAVRKPPDSAIIERTRMSGSYRPFLHETTINAISESSYVLGTIWGPILFSKQDKPDWQVEHLTAGDVIIHW